MSNCIERFKNRKNLSPTVEIPFPSKEQPILIFKIRRCSEVEKSKAYSDATHEATKFELKKDGLRSAIGSNIGYSMLGILRRHVEGWEHITENGEEPMEFSQSNLNELLDSMDHLEIMNLSGAYLTALSEDEENAGKKSQKDSKKH